MLRKCLSSAEGHSQFDSCLASVSRPVGTRLEDALCIWLLTADRAATGSPITVDDPPFTVEYIESVSFVVYHFAYFSKFMEIITLLINILLFVLRHITNFFFFFFFFLMVLKIIIIIIIIMIKVVLGLVQHHRYLLLSAAFKIFHPLNILADVFSLLIFLQKQMYHQIKFMTST